MLKQGVWQDWWPVIYHAVLQHTADPVKHPLHKNFWGYSRSFGQLPNEPFPLRILGAGPKPRLKDVVKAVGFSNANLTSWLRRRVCYIQGIKPDPH
jgi:hypothetical protein